jgi:hypothetical protein
MAGTDELIPRAADRRAAGARTAGARTVRRRGLLRRTGIVLPAAAIAAVAVAAVTVATYMVSPNGSGATSLAQAIDALPKTGSVAALQQEQQQIALMDAATSVLTAASKPAVVSPSQVEQQAAASAQQAQEAQQSEEQATSQVTVTAPVAPEDPTAAEQTGEQLMLAAGFSSSQWSCLYDLWEHESGWNVTIENTSSGAYGIPQALPGSKMAVDGADWQTDAATQIKWGLSYISSTYGTPCDAYNFDIANGGY